jgi:hypothetical protein
MPFARSLPAFTAISLVLHGSLSLLPGAAAWLERLRDPEAQLPNSVAMPGNSLETDAPTPEAAGQAAPAPDQEIEVDTTPEAAEATAPAPEPAAPEPPATSTEATPSVPPTPQPKPASSAPPKLRTAPSRATKPAAAPSEGAVASTASTGAPSAGTFGSEGLAPGVRRLGYAFTRAIPAATPADAAWRELPVGMVGTIRVQLTVDEAGKLGELELWRARPGEPDPPAVLRRMVERTLLLLRAGQFALSGSNGAGRERLTIEVRLRDEAPDEEGSEVVVQKKFEGATPGHPGYASFRYGTGRVFEAKVTTTPAPR